MAFIVGGPGLRRHDVAFAGMTKLCSFACLVFQKLQGSFSAIFVNQTTIWAYERFCNGLVVTIMALNRL